MKKVITYLMFISAVLSFERLSAQQPGDDRVMAGKETYERRYMKRKMEKTHSNVTEYRNNLEKRGAKESTRRFMTGKSKRVERKKDRGLFGRKERRSRGAR